LLLRAHRPSAAAVAEKPAGSADRRPLYFVAFLLLADAALVALIIAFVRCLYSPTQTVLSSSFQLLPSYIHCAPCRHQYLWRFSWLVNF
jgi:hypothetical protein